MNSRQVRFRACDFAGPFFGGGRPGWAPGILYGLRSGFGRTVASIEVLTSRGRPERLKVGALASSFFGGGRIG